MPATADYQPLDRHLFRVAHDTILDFPLHPAPGARVWAATMWNDLHHGSAWGRTMWQTGPGGRGFILDRYIHLGDVIEFGADTPSMFDRWYGYAIHADKVSITLIGPFHTPDLAADDGRRSLPTWIAAHERAITRSQATTP